MKIIFNEEEVGSFGDPKDPENTPTKLIERKRESLKLLWKFIGADSVEYVDNDKSEDYLITKKGKILKLSIQGNHYDGGWMNVEINSVKKRKEGNIPCDNCGGFLYKTPDNYRGRSPKCHHCGYQDLKK